MNKVARTMPGMAKMILMSCCCNHGPIQPRRPEHQYINQAGDHRRYGKRQIDQGKPGRFLPKKSNLATHQAAATPTTTFVGTAIAATKRVSLIDDQLSGLVRART